MSHLCSPLLSLHIINKLELNMNSHYWGKALIKLLKLTNSVYNFNNNGRETEDNGIKTTYCGGKACWQVITWTYKPCKARDSNHVICYSDHRYFIQCFIVIFYLWFSKMGNDPRLWIHGNLLHCFCVPKIWW